MRATDFPRGKQSGRNRLPRGKPIGKNDRRKKLGNENSPDEIELPGGRCNATGFPRGKRLRRDRLPRGKTIGKNDRLPRRKKLGERGVAAPRAGCAG